jgi:hypothetical protein
VVVRLDVKQSIRSQHVYVRTQEHVPPSVRLLKVSHCAFAAIQEHQAANNIPGDSSLLGMLPAVNKMT